MQIICRADKKTIEKYIGYKSQFSLSGEVFNLWKENTNEHLLRTSGFYYSLDFAGAINFSHPFNSKLNIRGFCLWLGGEDSNQQITGTWQRSQGAPAGGHLDKVNGTSTCNYAPKATASTPCSLPAVWDSPSYLKQGTGCLSQQHKIMRAWWTKCPPQKKKKKKLQEQWSEQAHPSHTLSSPTTHHKF